MKRLIGLALALAILGALLTAAPASAWVRKESQWWVWYVPNNDWAAAQSSTTIDITSPTGVLYVGVGWASTSFPRTHEDVVDTLVTNNGLDPHPLTRIKMGRGSKPVTNDTVTRRKYKWSAYRTDRRERIKGRLTVDIIRDDLTLSYGFATSNRAAPARTFGKHDKTLRRIERNTLYQPRSPEFGDF